jgi:hypothetical protein
MGTSLSIMFTLGLLLCGIPIFFTSYKGMVVTWGIKKIYALIIVLIPVCWIIFFVSAMAFFSK